MPPRLAKPSKYYSESDNENSNEETKQEDNYPKTPSTPSTPSTLSKSNGLLLTDYTERSFVVHGDTIPHANKLKELGGKFNPKLKIGPGWIFSIARKGSVQNYIDTGEVKPHVFEKKEFKSNTGNEDKIEKIFRSLISAFDSDGEYEGEEILKIIKKVKEKYS